MTVLAADVVCCATLVIWARRCGFGHIMLNAVHTRTLQKCTNLALAGRAAAAVGESSSHEGGARAALQTGGADDGEGHLCESASSS